MRETEKGKCRETKTAGAMSRNEHVRVRDRDSCGVFKALLAMLAAAATRYHSDVHCTE